MYMFINYAYICKKNNQWYARINHEYEKEELN